MLTEKVSRSHCECWLMEWSRNRLLLFLLIVSTVKQGFRILKEMKSDWVKQPNVLIPLDFCTLKFGFLKLKYQMLLPRFHLFKDTQHFWELIQEIWIYPNFQVSQYLTRVSIDLKIGIQLFGSVIFKSLGIWKLNYLWWPIKLLILLKSAKKCS